MLPCRGLWEQRADSSADWQTHAGKLLTAFAATDPDPTIFTGWENYEEVKPSEIKGRIYESGGITREKCPKCYVDEPSDKTYSDWNQ